MAKNNLHPKFREVSPLAQQWIREQYYSVCKNPKFFSSTDKEVWKEGYRVITSMPSSKIPKRIGKICKCHTAKLTWDWARSPNPTSLVSVRQTIGSWKESMFTTALLSDNYKLDIPTQDTDTLAEYKADIKVGLGKIREVIGLLRTSPKTLTLREAKWIATLSNAYPLKDNTKDITYLWNFAYVYAEEELAYEILLRQGKDIGNFDTTQLDNEFLVYSDYEAETLHPKDDNRLTVEHIVASAMGIATPFDFNETRVYKYSSQLDDRLRNMKSWNDWSNTYRNHVLRLYKEDFGFWRVQGYNSSLMTMAWEYISMKYFTTKGDAYNPSGIVARPNELKAKVDELCKIWEEEETPTRNKKILDLLEIEVPTTVEVATHSAMRANEEIAKWLYHGTEDVSLLEDKDSNTNS